MIRLDHRERVPDASRGAIVALGNFDGFHLGHQEVVGRAVEWARSEGRKIIVGTFAPHPRRYFQPDSEPFELTTLDQREELFAAAGADAMLVFHFDTALASTTATGFAHETMVERIGAAGIVTGEDFAFARGREGNTTLLSELGRQYGYVVHTVAPVEIGEDVVSSSRIRNALRDGDCETATRLMTRPFAIRGVVQHGDKLGRTIGFPTANLALGDYLRPRYGIYAVTGRIVATGEMLKGAANLGIRPSFDPPKELLEPYFFDFSGDLYGQEVEVALHHFLRGEAKFDDLDALTAQMGKDCEEAKRLLEGASS